MLPSPYAAYFEFCRIGPREPDDPAWLRRRHRMRNSQDVYSNTSSGSGSVVDAVVEDQTGEVRIRHVHGAEVDDFGIVLPSLNSHVESVMLPILAHRSPDSDEESCSARSRSRSHSVQAEQMQAQEPTQEPQVEPQQEQESQQQEPTQDPQLEPTLEPQLEPQPEQENENSSDCELLRISFTPFDAASDLRA